MHLRIIVLSASLLATCAFPGCSKQPESEASFAGAVSNATESDGLTSDDGKDEPTGGVEPLSETVDAPPFDGNSYALLIGCTKYDFLGEDARLRGPVNDVEMMGDLLKKRFGFPDDNIRNLIEGAGTSNRPTKDNITRELRHLADTVEPGDRVVLLLSGHGSQQPDDDPDNQEDPEPDGLDEIFCPADISGPEDDKSPYLVNALTDDELRKSIADIRNSGAFVWVIVDACHSGSGVRGTEVYRQLSPERFFSDTVLSKARNRSGVGTRSLAVDESSFDADSKQAGLVAIYAAQPHEPTLEMMLPDESDEAEWRGLLTYTMVKILTSAKTPLTYNDLVQRIHSEYIQAYGRLGPTPLIEGVAQHQQILGKNELPDTSRPILTVDDDDYYVVNVGRLHGVSVGTVFAVKPPAGEADEDGSLGHVQIIRSRLIESRVAPVAYDSIPISRDLRIGSQLEPVEVRHGPLSLKVAFDDQTGEGSDSQLATTIPAILESIEGAPGKRIKFVKDRKIANWIVRATSDEEIHLLPAQGWSVDERPPRFGPAPTDRLTEWLEERLGRISRVKSLLHLCDASAAQASGGILSFVTGKSSCEIDLNMRLVSTDDETTSEIDWTARHWSLTDGEQVVLDIANTGRESLDFTVLFIDSEFGITPLFPSFGVVADNRLGPGQSYFVGPLQVEATTVGLEHLVVIATKTQGQPADFGWLGQESLETVRSAIRRGHGQHSLGQLLQDALYTGQNIRGMRMADTESTCLRAISWQTIAKAETAAAERISVED